VRPRQPVRGSGVGAAFNFPPAAYLGDNGLALKALNAMFEQSFSFETKAFLFWRPVLRDLRGAPGFKTLLRKWGFVEYWRTTGNWGDFCRTLGEDDFECHRWVDGLKPAISDS
jgi:hypothetical protein